MKKVEKLKIMLVILLSVVMTIALSSFNVVCADDIDDIWGTGSSSTTDSTTSDDDWGTPTLENVTDNNNTVTDNTTTNNTTTNNTTTNNTTTNNTTNNTSTNLVFNTANTANDTKNSINSTTSNANSLAKTGVQDSKGIGAIILVVSGIVGIYSLKKVRDYKDM